MAIQNGQPFNNAQIPIQPVEFAFYVQESRAERYAKITILVVAILLTLSLVIMLGVRIFLK
jgi:hypothetical protein